MQVRARRAPRLLGAAPQQFRDQIVCLGKVGVAGLALVGMGRGLAGVVPIISWMRWRLFRPRSVDFSGVEAPTFFRIRKQVVGGGNLLEPRLRMLVARVEGRVPLLGQLPR